ncbi:MAG TPA: hypothetical protein VFQ61_31640 [Polyangiaceae bacterium]|nr:hypothetical protein [Polyangiaceae bacterium]
MAKGNHVFNHFEKTIRNAFEAFLTEGGVQVEDRAVDVNSAIAMPGSADAEAIRARYPRAWAKFKEIVSAPQHKEMEGMQDDSPVAANDPNSQSYGIAAAQFISGVRALASAQPGMPPGAAWQAMVKSGFDAAAADRYVNAAPRAGQAKRKADIERIRTFIKGRLNSDVSVWIQFMKLDHAGEK